MKSLALLALQSFYRKRCANTSDFVPHAPARILSCGIMELSRSLKTCNIYKNEQKL